MPDDPSPEPTPPAEAGTPNTGTNVSGGVNLDAEHAATIGWQCERQPADDLYKSTS